MCWLDFFETSKFGVRTPFTCAEKDLDVEEKIGAFRV